MRQRICISPILGTRNTMSCCLDRKMKEHKVSSEHWDNIHIDTGNEKLYLIIALLIYDIIEYVKYVQICHVMNDT